LSAEEFRKEAGIASANSTQLPDPVQTFDAAPFSKTLKKALRNQGFAAPTAIQAQGWPVAVNGDDLVAVAKTGSGKTLAFVMPALSMLEASRPPLSEGPVVLILAPTRELACQISEQAEKFAKEVDVASVCVYGGVPKPPQVKALRANPAIVVGTPGRVMDLLQGGDLKLGAVSFLVLDEGDRMLDMGFEIQMAEIMKHLSAKRQTLLFSATWPKSVQKLAAAYLKEELIHINVGETEDLAANKAISQQFYQLDDDEKEAKLWKIWDELEAADGDFKLIVFANTKRRIDKLQGEVRKGGYDCVAMHGDKTQQERDKGLEKFISGGTSVMIATDVCARGLDIKNVTHVLNFDMARDVESYVHRIGRTGRAGTTGTSITFFNHAYDTDCAPALAKIAEEAGQVVPDYIKKAAQKAGKGKNKQWRY